MKKQINMGPNRYQYRGVEILIELNEDLGMWEVSFTVDGQDFSKTYQNRKLLEINEYFEQTVDSVLDA